MIRFFTIGMACCLAVLSTKAQTFFDDFESYPAGALIAQSSPVWAAWSGPNGGGADDAAVSTANAYSGTKSLFFASTAASGGPDDILLPFGQVYNTGTFTFNTWMFVTAGKNAYINYQANATAGQIWAMDLFFEANGTVKFQNSGSVLLQASYPQGQWFEFNMTANLNNASWTVSINGTAVGSFQNQVFNIASINFYPIQNSSYFIDDVSFDHVPYTAPALNAAVMGLTVENGLTGQTRIATVQVRNLGTTAITSFDLTINYNGVQQTQSVTGVNYAPGSVNTVTLTQPITLAGGSLPATVTVSNVNGNAVDDDTADDVATATVQAVTPAAGKVVVAEEGTGTWCSWCPRGAVYMDRMNEKYSGYFAGIAVHNNDPMEYSPYDDALVQHIQGFPSALVDRMPEIDPSALEQDFLARIVVSPKVLLLNGATYDAATRELKVSVTSNWQASANGNQYKLALVLTEDSVTGTGSGWSQANSYAGGNNGVMGGYELLPNPVPASLMHYNHVARIILPGFDGAAVYPASVSNSTSVVNTFTVTLPVNWNVDRIHIVSMVIYKSGSTMHIDNAAQTTVGEAVNNGFVPGSEVTGVGLLHDPGATVALQPNPANAETNVALNLSTPQQVTMHVYSLEGRLIQSRDYGTLNGNVLLPIAVSGLSTGFYLVDVMVGEQPHRLRLIKE